MGTLFDPKVESQIQYSPTPIYSRRRLPLLSVAWRPSRLPYSQIGHSQHLVPWELETSLVLFAWRKDRIYRPDPQYTCRWQSLPQPTRISSWLQGRN